MLLTACRALAVPLTVGRAAGRLSARINMEPGQQDGNFLGEFLDFITQRRSSPLSLPQIFLSLSTSSSSFAVICSVIRRAGSVLPAAELVGQEYRVIHAVTYQHSTQGYCNNIVGLD